MKAVLPRRLLVFIGCTLLVAGWFSTTGCKKKRPYIGKRVLEIPTIGSIGSMDPITSNSTYDSFSGAQVAEPLLQYNYVKRPLKLEPLLLAKMPEASKDGKTYKFTLKKGIFFQDNKCFKGGKGRELVAKDVEYSMKRMADRTQKPLPSGWWVYKGRIVGFDDYRKTQYELTKKGKKFNYDAPVKGIKVTGKYTFTLHLIKPFPQLLYIFAFQKTAIVPREAVEYYAKSGRGGLRQNPVGTGPYILKKWIKNVRVVYEKNPKYKHSTFPTDGFSKRDLAEGFKAAAGKALPMADVLIINVFKGQAQPMWLKFKKKHLDFSTVGAEYFKETFDKKRKLRPAMKKQGITAYSVPLLDFIYTGFNFKDKLVGSPGGDKARYLRKALSLAIDYDEINRRFYNGEVVIYKGVIPPTMPEYAGARFKPDLKKAKEYLAKAGYPGGKGLPTLVISTSASSLVKEREDVLKRQFAKIGVKMRYELSTFPQLSAKLRSGQTQMFSLAWGSDYPDAENNLQLFWGPNKAPGPNAWYYDNPKFNALYEKVRIMHESAERSKLYKEMNQILIEDVPFLGSMARTRRYLKHKHLQYFKPNETIATYFKYLSVPARKK